MAKLLKTAHIVLVLLMLLYSGLVLEQFVVKLLDPGNQSLRFWKPGGEVGVIAAAFVALLGILACSTGMVKNPSWRLLGILHGLWLVCFTWFGWFNVGGPFTLQELVGVDLSDAAAVSRAETVHLLQALAAYLVIVLISSAPLLLRWLGGRGPSGGSNSIGEASNPALQHH
jgi:hypothetical protein